MEVVHVLAISGSLRRASFNTAALRAAMELKPEGMQIELGSIADFPLYNEDVQQLGWPEPVARVRGQVERADGILISTPEYNFSVSGVLKNAVDWLSQDTDLISIRSKDRAPPRLVFGSALKQDAVKYGNVIGVPVALGLYATFRLLRRRRLRLLPWAPGAAA